MTKNTQSEEHLNSLWKEYHSFESIEVKQQLMNQFIWLIKYVINSMSLSSNSILVERDFLHYGILALDDCIKRYQPEMGTKFETFAVPRIKGTILDELRKLDKLSRGVRKKAQDFLYTQDALRSLQQREVTLDEVRIKLGVTKEEFQSYLSAAASAVETMSLDDSISFHRINDDEENFDVLGQIPDPNEHTIIDSIIDSERKAFLVDYIKALPEKKRIIVSLYYYEEITFKEIGQVLNITESRVCQIHSQVIKDLRITLQQREQ
jgi:RNA polymerase sigma factor for flagellar operon FliA